MSRILKLKNKMNMKNLIKYGFIAVVSCFLLSCGGTKLEQDVSMRRVCDNTFYVSTYVKVYNWYGDTKTIEYWEQTVVEESGIDSVKTIEYNKAIPTFQKVKKCNCN